MHATILLYSFTEHFVTIALVQYSFMLECQCAVMQRNSQTLHNQDAPVVANLRSTQWQSNNRAGASYFRLPSVNKLGGMLPQDKF